MLSALPARNHGWRVTNGTMTKDMLIEHNRDIAVLTERVSQHDMQFEDLETTMKDLERGVSQMAAEMLRLRYLVVMAVIMEALRAGKELGVMDVIGLVLG